MSFLPQTNRVALGEEIPDPITRRRQARGDHRRRRHRRGLPRHLHPPGCALDHQIKIVPRPPDFGPTDNPGRSSRTSSGSPPRTRRSGTRVTAYQHRGSSARTARSGRSAGSRWTSRRPARRSRGPSALPGRLALLSWASSARRSPGWAGSSALSSTGGATSRCKRSRRAFQGLHRGRHPPRQDPHRVGDGRGPRRRGRRRPAPHRVHPDLALPDPAHGPSARPSEPPPSLR